MHLVDLPIRDPPHAPGGASRGELVPPRGDECRPTSTIAAGSPPLCTAAWSESPSLPETPCVAQDHRSGELRHLSRVARRPIENNDRIPFLLPRRNSSQSVQRNSDENRDDAHDAEEHHDEGVAYCERSRGIVDLKEDYPKSCRNEEKDGTRNAEKEEGTLLGDERNNPAEDAGTVPAGSESRALGI